MDEGKPLFVQIAEHVEGSILDGSIAEETQAFSGSVAATS